MQPIRNDSKRNRTAPKSDRSRSTSRYPSIESLESRELFSVNVIFDASTAVLKVIGNGDNDRIVAAYDDYGTMTVNGAEVTGATLYNTNQLLIYGGGGDDLIDVSRIKGFGGRIELDGESGDDRIIGSQVRDVIRGGPGNDVVFGNWGDDWVDGGEGKDEIHGGEDQNVLHGGNGDDWIDGGHRADEIRGWDGNDTLHGGPGNDWIDGWDGNDRIYGQAGRDELHGGNGDDLIDGGDDEDRIFGWNGNDVLYGGSKKWDDSIAGGSGRDLAQLPQQLATEQ